MYFDNRIRKNRQYRIFLVIAIASCTWGVKHDGHSDPPSVDRREDAR